MGPAIEANGRTGFRSNVFLAATLRCGNGQSPVRVRNISPRGALVDGPGLPAAGTRIRLARGSLSAVGSIAWSADGQAGLAFDGPVDVADWTRHLGNPGQQRVDRVVNALRDTGSTTSEADEEKGADGLPVLSAEIDQLCARLAAMKTLPIEFDDELLKLDAIAQSLRVLATGRAF
jgi:hypothetical protein